MKLLRRTLKVQAALWAVFGLACLVSPSWITSLLAGAAAPGDDAIVRVLGVTALVIAMTMVLVAQHMLETWWWAWAFALLQAGLATVCILRALTGADGSPVTPWWVAGIVSAVFAALDLIGLAGSEQEKPFV